jgi:hypothetical protein
MQNTIKSGELIMKKIVPQTIFFAGIFLINLACSNYNHNSCIKFYGNEVFIPEKLGKVKLYKDSAGFHIFKDGEIYDIQNCFCDPLLRKMSDEQLFKFLGRNKPKVVMLTQNEIDQIDPNEWVEITGSEKDFFINQLFGGGYISINQMNDGEYILHAKIRLPGGSWGFVAKLFTGNVVNVLVADFTIVALGPVGLIVVAGIGGGALGVALGKELFRTVHSDETPSANHASNQAADDAGSSVETAEDPTYNGTIPQAKPAVRIRIVEGRP